MRVTPCDVINGVSVFLAPVSWGGEYSHGARNCALCLSIQMQTPWWVGLRRQIGSVGLSVSDTLTDRAHLGCEVLWGYTGKCGEYSGSKSNRVRVSMSCCTIAIQIRSTQIADRYG
jgi:hypothetical protein